MIDIPNYVAKQNGIVVKKWLAVKAVAGNGEIGTVVANNWLQNQVQKANNREEQVSSLKFNMVTEGKEFIKRASNGDEYIDFVLADDQEDSDGLTIATEALSKWADDINNGKVLVGDIDHEEYDYVMSNIPDPKEASSIISKMKKGIAKTIKAFVDKGKLFVRAIIDKRYRNKIEKFKGVSLEALLDTKLTPNGKIATGGELLGFTFAVKNNPINSRAVIL